VNACRILFSSLLLTVSPSTLGDAVTSSVSITEPQHNEAIAPGLDQLKPFPEYSVKATTERRLATSLENAAHSILDYQNQCMDCQYVVSSVLTQEVFDRDTHPHQFIVWRDVSKEIKLLTSKIHIRSSSFVEVRLYRSSDGEVIVIDSQSVEASRAQTLANQHQRTNDPAFSVLHARWTLTRLDPDDNEGQRVHIAGVTGGKAQGMAAMAPKSILRKELTSAMAETLDFIN
jgi:hypothetical protein